MRIASYALTLVAGLLTVDATATEYVSNVGEVPPGSSVTCAVAYTNDGETRQALGLASSSCSCTTGRKAISISPGSTVQIPLEIKSGAAGNPIDSVMSYKLTEFNGGDATAEETIKVRVVGSTGTDQAVTGDFNLGVLPGGTDGACEFEIADYPGLVFDELQWEADEWPLSTLTFDGRSGELDYEVPASTGHHTLAECTFVYVPEDDTPVSRVEVHKKLRCRVTSALFDRSSLYFGTQRPDASGFVAARRAFKVNTDEPSALQISCQAPDTTVRLVQSGVVDSPSASVTVDLRIDTGKQHGAVTRYLVVRDTHGDEVVVPATVLVLPPSL